MRLHRLTVCGIGPFVTAYTIDFDEFRDAGLFLLEGPTGSGKSTVIDAIVFALYGGLAGRSTSKDRLRSDYIDDKADSYVELVFSTHTGMYQVRRTPQFVRTTRTGSESTVNQTASLARFDSPDAAQPTVLVSRVSDVGTEIERITGLTRDQFTQTVVLPQGEFASFLRAKPADRQELLQNLFGTEVFERVQKILEAQRKEAQQARSAADATIRSAIGAFTGAAGLEGDQAAALIDAQGDDAEVTTRIDDVVAQLTLAVASAKQVRDAAAIELADAQKANQAAADAAKVRDELAALRLRAKNLEEQRPAIDELSASLANADRAEPVAAALRELTSASQAEGQQQRRLADLVQILDAADAAGDADDWKARVIELRDLVTSLAPTAEQEATLAALHEAVAQLEAQLLASKADHSKQQQIVAQTPPAIAALEAQISDLEAAAARVELLAQQRATVQARVDAMQQIAVLEPQRTAAALLASSAAAAADAAETSATQARARWRSGIAAELASTLVPGEPCRVCGSVDHPTPAQPTDDHVSLPEVEQLEAEARQTRVHLQAAIDQQRELDEQLAGLVAVRGDDDDLATQLQSVRDDLAVARDAVEQLPHKKTERATLTSALDLATARVTELAAEVARVEQQLAQARETAASTAEAVDAARAEFASVAERMTTIHTRIDALEACIRVAGELATAQALVSSRQDTVSTALAASGFDDVERASAAAATKEQRDDWRKTITDFTNEVALVERELAHERFVGVDAAAVIDLDAPAQRLREATASHNDAVAVHATATATEAASISARAAVHDAMAASAKVRADTATVIRMADLVAASNSANQLAMPLVAFVLREEFEHVVDAANARLQLLSEGRFLLRRTEVKEGNMRTGLGLEVVDLDTDRARDPGSLSGGETFYTSLALALGLSDVVVARSGGINLETLFVDEGFGSLDPERLDDVLAVLDKLKSSGRTIGVISHVSEMKEAIPARVEVRRTDHGSTIAVRA